MKKIRIIILLFIISVSAFSQIQPTPASYKKIKFTYTRTPNFLIEKKIVYADTNIFKTDFPKIKFEKVKSPTDSINIVGKAALTKFNEDDKIRLRGIIYHCMSISEYEFNVKNGITKVNSLLFDDRLKKLYPDLFFDNNSYDQHNAFRFKTKNNKSRIVGSDSPNKLGNENLLVVWEKEYPTLGTFKNKMKFYNGLQEYNNLLIINPDLPKYVTPVNLFTNCEYGIDTIISLYKTTKLISVKYE